MPGGVGGQVLSGDRAGAYQAGTIAHLVDVDRWVRTTNRREVEIHPEVSFDRLAGHPFTASKKIWAGAQLRQQLLADTGILLTGNLSPAGHSAALDAA